MSEISTATQVGEFLGWFFRPLLRAVLGGCSAWIAGCFFGPQLQPIVDLAGLSSVAQIGICLGFLSAYIGTKF